MNEKYIDIITAVGIGFCLTCLALAYFDILVY